VLVLGMGGGGDVVGALATARLCQALGAEFVLGGVAWERWPVDPHPGPRPMREIRGGRPLSEATVLADERTTTPTGVAFAESRMAGYICSDTVLVDVWGGPPAIAAGLEETCRRLACDLVVLLDVGGDVLGHGTEPGLASPLCDAVMLAAGLELSAEMPVICGVYGAGCDGELTPAEVSERLAEVARAGAMLGSWGLTPALCEQIEAAAAVVPTEASLLAVRCARGDTGWAEIRGGRRRVELTPAAAITNYFDPVRAGDGGCNPLASAVRNAAGLEEAEAILAERGIRTELAYERGRAADEAATG
jgi:hypothetical protein